MKVSVVCIYYNRNYGSVLQSLALNNFLEKLGCEVNVIPFKDTAGTKEKLDILFDLKLPKLFDLEIVKRKIQEKKARKAATDIDEEYVEGVKLRELAYDRFVKAYFNVPERVLNRNELAGFVEDSDVVVVGSDQLWTPHDILIGYHTLSFVPNGVKKISYATSFGVKELPTAHIKSKAKKFLSDMDEISVREIQGKQIIENLGVDKPVHVVVDPTMLLTKKDWDKIVPSTRIVDGKYIFCYFLGNNPDHREFAQKIKEQLGLKIVALQHMDEYIAGDGKYVDKVLYDIDPSQFVALIRDAELILTDSFHLSVFSVLYHKKFFVMNRHKDGEVRSTNSRIDTFCELLNLEKRHLTGDLMAYSENNILQEIDYDIVGQRLYDSRNSSITFLKNALGIGE